MVYWFKEESPVGGRGFSDSVLTITDWVKLIRNFAERLFLMNKALFLFGLRV
jgi:hypothetical protein